MPQSLIFGLALVLLGASSAWADADVAKVADVQVKRDSPDQPGIYHIKVTIEYEDTGWDNYVEAWEVRGPDGSLLGVRPFFEPALERTRTITALAGVVIPDDINTVTVRARTYPVGYVGDPVEVSIPH